MPGKTGQTRGSKIPLPDGHWWWTEANAARERRGDARKGYRSITEEIRQGGVDVSEDAVRRVFEDHVLTWELAGPLCAVLRVSMPAVILSARPSLVDIASGIESLRTLGKNDDPDDQGGDVASLNEPRKEHPGDDSPGPRRK